MLKTIKGLVGQKSIIRLAWHRGKAFLAALRYGFPARRLTVIGVTGTDGKTTTVGMVAHILTHAGHKVVAASTAYMQLGHEFRENSTHLTSISPFTLQKLLREAVQKGCSRAVIEMSSHGLVQGRVHWTFPSIACFTNISMEHLDYHKTMEQYIKDKGIMFRMLRGKGTKILNAADETFSTYSKIPSAHTITYSTSGVANISAKNIQSNLNSTSAELSTGDTLKLHISGIFNIDNALCAIAAAESCGVQVKDSCAALETFRGMPGRMERIDEGQTFALYVDFSVSPQSYEKALKTLQQVVQDTGRVMVLCSSCGNRMQEKRAEVGRICSLLADVVVVTEDETYGEDPEKVLNEVWKGVNPNTCEAHKIFDRREAITFLCSHAQAGDAIVLCGMGPFSTMNKLEGPVEWDERKVARDVLRTLTK